MFNDTSEELARLEAELLSEDDPDTYEDDVPEEPEEEDLWLYEDTRPAEGSGVYQNYSNDYGKKLRNYASGYRAYNSDDTDEDLDSYSEEVRHGKKSGGCLMALVWLLVLVVVALLVLVIARERGLL